MSYSGMFSAGETGEGRRAAAAIRFEKGGMDAPGAPGSERAGEGGAGPAAGRPRRSANRPRPRAPIPRPAGGPWERRESRRLYPGSGPRPRPDFPARRTARARPSRGERPLERGARDPGTRRESFKRTRQRTVSVCLAAVGESVISMEAAVAMEIRACRANFHPGAGYRIRIGALNELDGSAVRLKRAWLSRSGVRRSRRGRWR